MIIFMKARETIIENIEKLMKERGIRSHADLARRAKMSPRTVNNFMNAESFTGSPTIETAERLAGALAVPLWVLLIKDGDGLHKLLNGFEMASAPARQEILSYTGYVLDRDKDALKRPSAPYVSKKARQPK